RAHRSTYAGKLIGRLRFGFTDLTLSFICLILNLSLLLISFLRDLIALLGGLPSLRLQRISGFLYCLFGCFSLGFSCRFRILSGVFPDIEELPHLVDDGGGVEIVKRDALQHRVLCQRRKYRW